MDVDLAFLLHPTYWHWFTLAVILFGFEIMSMSFFLLFPAGAAVVCGFVLMVWPDLDIRLQLAVFALLSVVATAVGRPLLVRARQSSRADGLNARGRQYLGRRVQLETALEAGRGQIRLDDGWWSAVSDTGETIPEAAVVEITGVEGSTMRVRAVRQ